MLNVWFWPHPGMTSLVLSNTFTSRAHRPGTIHRLSDASTTNMSLEAIWVKLNLKSTKYTVVYIHYRLENTLRYTAYDILQRSEIKKIFYSNFFSWNNWMKTIKQQCYIDKSDHLTMATFYNTKSLVGNRNTS